MPEPGSRVPLLRVALMVEELHVTRLPVVVSLSTTRPDLAVTAPPGWTVQVVAAMAVVEPRTAANAAAETVNRVCANRLLIFSRSFRLDAALGRPVIRAAQ